MADYIDYEHEPVSYHVYELSQARMERTNLRLFVALIVTIVLLFASNVIWIAYINQFDTLTYEQDGEGVNTIFTNVIGGIHNGAEDESPGQAQAEH